MDVEARAQAVEARLRHGPWVWRPAMRGPIFSTQRFELVVGDNICGVVARDHAGWGVGWAGSAWVNGRQGRRQGGWWSPVGTLRNLAAVQALVEAAVLEGLEAHGR